MTHSWEEEPSFKLEECDPSWGMNRCPGPEQTEVGPEQILASNRTGLPDCHLALAAKKPSL